MDDAPVRPGPPANWLRLRPLRRHPARGQAQQRHQERLPEESARVPRVLRFHVLPRVVPGRAAVPAEAVPNVRRRRIPRFGNGYEPSRRLILRNVSVAGEKGRLTVVHHPGPHPSLARVNVPDDFPSRVQFLHRAVHVVGAVQQLELHSEVFLPRPVGQVPPVQVHIVLADHRGGVDHFR